MLCVVLGSYVLSIPLVNLFFDICYEGGGGIFCVFKIRLIGFLWVGATYFQKVNFIVFSVTICSKSRGRKH